MKYVFQILVICFLVGCGKVETVSQPSAPPEVKPLPEQPQVVPLIVKADLTIDRRGATFSKEDLTECKLSPEGTLSIKFHQSGHDGEGLFYFSSFSLSLAAFDKSKTKHTARFPGDTVRYDFEARRWFGDYSQGNERFVRVDARCETTYSVDTTNALRAEINCENLKYMNQPKSYSGKITFACLLQ